MKLIIGQPYIKSSNGKSRLCADISGILQKPLFYDVDSKWEEFLVTERSDAFLVGLLPYALSHSTETDILELICEAPISEKLYYQLVQHYIPTMIKAFSWCSNIKIKGTLDHRNLCRANAVGTGISGGVDSYYSLLKSLKEDPVHYKVTHGLYCETEQEGSNFNSELQNKMREMAEKICEESNIECISMRSNLCTQVYAIGHELIVSQLFMSYALAMEKLFCVYYFSSSHTYLAFDFKEYSSEYHQLFNVHCFSIEGLDFYTTGSESIRHEKTGYIAEFELPKKYLMVCRNPRVENGVLKNCSRCSKCTRTIIDLDLYDKLDAFDQIFDVENYRKDPAYYWGYLYFKGKKDPFIKETLELVKEKHKKVPFGARIAGIIKIVKNGFKRGNSLQITYRP